MKHCLLLLLLLGFVRTAEAQPRVRIYDAAAHGIAPNSKVDTAPGLQKLLKRIRNEHQVGDSIVVRFRTGTYEFHPEGGTQRTYYISNHDQDNPKSVGIALEGWENLTLDGCGAEFRFHGRMIPISLIESKNCKLTNFSIDFPNPQIIQVQIAENKGKGGMVFEVAPWVSYRIDSEGFFQAYGKGWENRPHTGIAFDGDKRHLVYRTGDLTFSTQGVQQLKPRLLHAPQWVDERLLPGTVVAMRTYHRPCPGIFLAENVNTTLDNVKVHYAEGMGLVAQLCENITLHGFSVCLRGKDDPRYFTTQADATHFSSCKGQILSTHGTYEGMMDDAINVHGTYLKVVQRIDSHTLVGRYMHPQAWGFHWGDAGDSVAFVRSSSMDAVGCENRLTEIRPHDAPTVDGAKEFLLRFEQPIPEEVTATEGFGIENLTWCPQVVFAHNTVRNNRARGALFSTPRPVWVEENLFDHTSGTAILLCGDCNGWYETGACRRVLIRKNRFVNALTNMFQFTNAVISIYPEIPQLSKQMGFFHGGEAESIVIEDNVFETFDAPILYAKSVDGLVYRRNRVLTNQDFQPFHWNRSRILLERTNRVKVED